MNDSGEIIAAVRRSDRVLVEQLSEWEPLAFGVAHTSNRHPALASANQLREVWLVDVSAEAAYERAEAYYAERGLTCRLWTPASGQAPEPVERLLLSRGWRCVDRAAMYLASMDAMTEAVPPAIRVLPARAMPKAFRRTFAAEGAAANADPVLAGAAADAQAEAAIDRLNDSNHDAFVATVDGVAAGRISYLQAGDIARLDDITVLRAFRGRGVGGALVSHVLRLAKRLLPKTLVATAPADCPERIGFLRGWGFELGGVVRDFVRPAG